MPAPDEGAIDKIGAYFFSKLPPEATDKSEQNVEVTSGKGKASLLIAHFNTIYSVFHLTI